MSLQNGPIVDRFWSEILILFDPKGDYAPFRLTIVLLLTSVYWSGKFNRWCENIDIQICASGMCTVLARSFANLASVCTAFAHFHCFLGRAFRTFFVIEYHLFIRDGWINANWPQQWTLKRQTLSIVVFLFPFFDTKKSLHYAWWWSDKSNTARSIISNSKLKSYSGITFKFSNNFHGQLEQNCSAHRQRWSEWSRSIHSPSIFAQNSAPAIDSRYSFACLVQSTMHIKCNRQTDAGRQIKLDSHRWFEYAH